jgi:hypothetical protein
MARIGTVPTDALIQEKVQSLPLAPEKQPEPLFLPPVPV